MYFYKKLSSKQIMKHLVRLYIWFLYLTRNIIKLSGLGRVQKLIRKDFVFTFLDKKMYFKHGIEGSYDLLLIGKPNEPETHLFFKKIIPYLPYANFIDIGASVGEMVIGTSIYDNIQNIYAFEPRTECTQALKKTLQLNNENRIKIYEAIVSNCKEIIPIYMNTGGTSSGIYNTSSSNTKTVMQQTITLDSVLPEHLENTIILIDVEGAEPLVLKGGVNFIKNNTPLIIFEYNNVSKKHFNLDDISSILGSNYLFYRIKHDASLDTDFSNSWNVVAIPRNSIFEKILL